MLRIDAHQHFWKFDPVRDTWINDDMKMIQRDFLPDDLYPLLQQNDIAGCVAVQADQSEAENIFLLELAEKFDFIKGVVGWVDLESDNIMDKLAHLRQFEKLKGFRHILQAEKDDAFMLRPDFRRGIAALHHFGFTYDILIFPHHLKNAIKLVAAYPGQRFVIDHMAKPPIREQKIEEWKQDIHEIARYPNVWCKVSGMVTEADWKLWKRDDLVPYLDVVCEAFGMKRLMFGSDWPVCLVAAYYGQVVEIVKDHICSCSLDDQAALLGGNATTFYSLT